MINNHPSQLSKLIEVKLLVCQAATNSVTDLNPDLAASIEPIATALYPRPVHAPYGAVYAINFDLRGAGNSRESE